MITLTTDYSPERAEAAFEVEGMQMFFMAITAAGINCDDLKDYKRNIDMSVKAYDEAHGDSAAMDRFIKANSDILAENGIQVKNVLQEAEEGQYPMIVSTITNGFDKFNVVAQIHRALAADDETVKLYTDNAIGYEIDGTDEQSH